VDKRRGRLSFETLSAAITVWAGSTTGFAVALAIVAAWALSGPLFDFSNRWQLVINTGTTIVTFLMVFLIQRAQNKDAIAIHLKLNELVAAIEGASNRLIDVESLSEKDLIMLATYYGELTKLARAEDTLTKSHSIEEARARHVFKERRGQVRSPAAGVK
jgi:low affinity Fe/Cu permease